MLGSKFPETNVVKRIGQRGAGCIESRKWRLSGRVIVPHSRPCYPVLSPAIPAIPLPCIRRCLGLAPTSQPSGYHLKRSASQYKILLWLLLCQHKCETRMLLILFIANKILNGASGSRGLGQPTRYLALEGSATGRQGFNGIGFSRPKQWQALGLLCSFSWSWLI